MTKILISLKVVLILFICFNGCDLPLDTKNVAQTKGVLVLNEGAFGQSNAEITYFSFEDGSVIQSIYRLTNPEKILGDVANHFTIYRDRMYIVVNNSQKVEIITANDRRSVGTIQLDSKPRQIAILNDRKAYVSNMDSTISVIDLSTLKVSKKISVGLFPEAVVIASGKVYVAVSGFGFGNEVVVIDPNTDTILKRITTPDGPTFASVANQLIYLSCTGKFDFFDPSKDTDGAIVVIDPAIDKITSSRQIKGHPGKIALNSTGEIFLIGPGSFSGGPIWKIRSSDLLVVSEKFIEGYYYGVGIDEFSGDIYVGDAKGFAGNGVVSVFDPNGRKYREFASGIGPSWFAFVR